MIHCKAQEVMNLMESKGFNPYWASECCYFKSGEVVFGDTLMNPPKNALWRTYKFPDGSMMNIHDRGCTVFYPGEDCVHCNHYPPTEVSKLY